MSTEANSRYITLRIDGGLLADVEALAREYHKSRNWMLNELVRTSTYWPVSPVDIVEQGAHLGG